MKAVYKLLIFIILFLTMIVVSITANINNNNRDYEGIVVNYPKQSYFNKHLYVENLIQNQHYTALLKEGLFNTIENSISSTPGIQKAEVYKLYNGNIIIDIYDRKPLAFKNQDSRFFIDENSNLIKDDSLKLELPIVDNNTSEKDINKIVKVILEINKDKYLKGQFESFWVENEQIFADLKSFDFNVKIGNSYKIKEKMKKLKAYCAYYNKDSSNLNFNQIDLTYNNQLVAIKN